MKYVVHVSGGAGSTIAAHRAVERHGEEAVVLVFADTRTEDASLYELVRMLFDRWPGVETHWLDSGMNIWDCFDKNGVIRLQSGGGACKASVELKQKPLREFMQSRFPYEWEFTGAEKNIAWLPVEPNPESDDDGEYVARWLNGEATIVSGLDFTEEDRRARFDGKQFPYPTWHPLADSPILSFCQQRQALEDWGYPTQALYDRGYPHNNCGGGCVLAGLSQWAGLLKDNPERYRWHEERERQFIANQADGKKFTVLRDRRGGKTRSMTLEEFRHVVETEGPPTNDFRSTCGCMTQLELFTE